VSLDLYTTQQQILAYLDANLAFKVASGGVEEAENLTATQGVLDPHVVLRFGSPQPVVADQSFAGARYDGQYSTVDAMCVGASDAEARGLSSKVTRVLLGYRPNANAGELKLDWGGGTFTVIAEGSRPQFLISWVSFRFATNLYDVGA
jgi:hypothetical protein